MNWEFTVFAADMTRERAEELFTAIADLAHERDEQVTCSMGPAEDE
jgi:hypothetical protein